MKYPHLELVVGLELDQTVVRYSFKHYGATPYFHDPKMQWWFGDASKSFLALPKEYFGSFDLVIVDLLSFIADTLKVTDNLTLMDAAGLLMKKDGGIIVKQEDFSIQMIDRKFAKYTAKMYFSDVPHLCEQTITMGSNSVDFFSAKRYHHGIETFVRDEYLVHNDGGDSVLPFPAWREYHRAFNETCTTESSRMLADPPSSSSSGNIGFGILLIIEAEDLTLLESVEDYQAKVRSIATQIIGRSPMEEVIFHQGHFLVLFREGYITVRAFPEARYIGFDVMLWDELHKLESLKEALIVGFGGNPETSASSFRIVSGGMSGVSEAVCQAEELTSIANNNEALLCQGIESSFENAPASLSIDVTVVSQVVSSMVPQQSPRVLAVLCGEEGTTCASLDTVQEDSRNFAVPVYSCNPTLDATACRNSLGDVIQKAVKNNKKLDGVIVDTTAPFESCQVMHKILSKSEIYDALLEDDYLVLTSVSTEEKWRSVFIDRFRTELGAFFAPSRRGDFRLNRDGYESRWSIFVSGLDDFFWRLSNTLSNITSQTGWTHTLDAVESGEKAFVVDFVAPKTLRDKYYDKTDAKKQWNSQKPVGYQAVVQMEQVPARKPFQQNERVLVNTIYDGPWDKIYEPAVIMEIRDNDRVLVKYEVPVVDNVELVPADRIMRFPSSDKIMSQSFEVGDIVLYDSGIEGHYLSCMIAKLRGDGKHYDLAKLGIEGKKYYNVSRSQVMSQSESEDFFEQVSPFTQEELLLAFRNAILQLNRSLLDDERRKLSPKPFVTGDGLVAVAFWSHGNAVMKWNGQGRVEVNLFLDREDPKGVKGFRSIFIKSLGNLNTVMVDEFPRGYGQIVNFASQMVKPPTWIKVQLS
jgi:hypothetical protein